MHMDPLIPLIVGTIAAVLALGLLLGHLRQPAIIAYLAAGVVIGPAGLGWMEDQVAIARLGEIGVILLLFFVGMEISLKDLLERWKLPVLGTLLQIGLSVGFVALAGPILGWPMGRILLLGFVTSLSSTAVVVRLLRQRGDHEKPIGRDVIGVLLVQDLAIVPMLIAVGMLGGAKVEVSLVFRQVGGALGIAALLWVAVSREVLSLPLGRRLREDKELQVFAATLACFSLALATGLLGLSAALGAFVAGILVGAAKETHWVHEALFPLHVLLLALFFVSVGMLIDLEFVQQNLGAIVALLLAVLLVNTFVNAFAFKALGRTWPNSLFGGAVLAQIGEFSFVLAAVGRQSGLIGNFAYQTTVAVIALSMFVSPAWVATAQRFRAAP